jgi:hypothetical protein
MSAIKALTLTVLGWPSSGRLTRTKPSHTPPQPAADADQRAPQSLGFAAAWPLQAWTGAFAMVG